MSVLLLVRHGQASFGAADYDQLSPLGVHQSERLGRALHTSGIDPARIYSGTMKRHLQTSQATARTARWPVEVTTLRNWNEFDHHEVLRAEGGVEGGADTNDANRFLASLEKSTARWASGEHEHDYAEPFASFTARVLEGLELAIAGLSGSATAVVFTSGGAISWITASLLGGGYPQWRILNRVAINTGVTKVVLGRTGTSIVSFNNHSHLRPSHITYL